MPTTTASAGAGRRETSQASSSKSLSRASSRRWLGNARPGGAKLPARASTFRCRSWPSYAAVPDLHGSEPIAQACTSPLKRGASSWLASQEARPWATCANCSPARTRTRPSSSTSADQRPNAARSFGPNRSSPSVSSSPSTRRPSSSRRDWPPESFGHRNALNLLDQPAGPRRLARHDVRTEPGHRTHSPRRSLLREASAAHVRPELVRLLFHVNAESSGADGHVELRRVLKQVRHALPELSMRLRRARIGREVGDELQPRVVPRVIQAIVESPGAQFVDLSPFAVDEGTSRVSPHVLEPLLTREIESCDPGFPRHPLALMRERFVARANARADKKNGHAVTVHAARSDVRAFTQGH